jgi:hypothetical protein
MKISILKSQRLALSFFMTAFLFINAPKGASAAVQFGNFYLTQGTGSVTCSWEALSQTNNASFTIEKTWTMGSRTASMTWTQITSIQGAGNSHSTVTYNYMDIAPGMVGNQQVTGGYLIYRIRATDVDGHSTSTPSKAIRWGSVNETADNAIAATDGNDTRTAYLSYFSATAKSTNVYCSWQSKPGTDNSVYTVERSTNGTTWAAFATVNGDGVTPVTQKYTVIDYNVTGSVRYYRLAEFNSGSGTTYSPVRKVILSGGSGGRPEEAATLSSYSSAEGLHVDYNSSSAGAVNLIVSDYLGKVITQKTLQAAEGNNTYTIDDIRLRSGIYHVTVVKDGEAATQTIAKN